MQRGELSLSVKERAVMFALLAEARQLANPELEERVGFRLDGKERRKLNDLKFVESTKVGRAFAHELSDAGWGWCAQELTASPSGRGGSMERALYALLGGLDQYLRSERLSLADVFRPDTGAIPDEQDARPESEGSPRTIEAGIQSCYRSLARVRGDFVRLSDLRPLLAGAPRPDVDAVLVGMYAARRVNLIPQSNQQALTDADRESALRVGGEYKHLISIER